MSIVEIKNLIKEKLKKHNKNVNETDLILQIALNKSYSEILIMDELTRQEERQVFRVLNKRLKSIPFDKIVGFTNFCGLKIEFDKNVLSPRKETEIICDYIINKIGNSNLKILDLCAGSGAIGLSIRKHTNAIVTLSDISRHSIKEIKRNAVLNDINVDIVRSDMFLGLQERYDIIICNPPYITKFDMLGLEKEVKKYDPKLALDGGIDGLDFYRIIEKNFTTYLNEKGVLYLEIGYDQSEKILEIFKNYNVEFIKDYSGIDRFVSINLGAQNVK